MPTIPPEKDGMPNGQLLHLREIAVHGRRGKMLLGCSQN
jgi:hypothetical protein